MAILSIRIDESLKSLGWQAIVAHSIKFNEKPETMSAYVRRLIKEDHQRMRQELTPKDKL